jgi:glycosyltransferase involved in cell wall biosynthesis
MSSSPSRARARPIKIVITIPWGERLGGAENILWTFLRHVDRQRVLPTAVFFAPGDFEREVAALGLKTSVIPAGRMRQARAFTRAVWRFAAFLKDTSPDLILNWSAKTQVYGSVAATLARMPGRVVWWQQGIPDRHWLDRLATVLPARAVGCYSSPAKRAQESHWPHRQAWVIYPGIDPPELVTESQRLKLRQQLGIPPDRIVIGIVGRLQPWKGQHRLLRALAYLLQRGHAVHGLVVGGNAYDLSPGYEEALHELIRDLGLSSNVTFTGQVADATPYVQAMEISVNASTAEPFGLVLLEAMAVGVPVVAFAAGGPAEIIESDRSGVLVAADQEGALAEGLRRLVDDRAFRCRVGRGGQERFNALFSAERMTDEMERFFLGACPN